MNNLRQKFAGIRLLEHDGGEKRERLPLQPSSKVSFAPHTWQAADGCFDRDLCQMWHWRQCYGETRAICCVYETSQGFVFDWPLLDRDSQPCRRTAPPRQLCPASLPRHFFGGFHVYYFEFGNRYRYTKQISMMMHDMCVNDCEYGCLNLFRHKVDYHFSMLKFCRVKLPQETDD